MPANTNLIFNAVQQFVIWPDRYYRVELRGDMLYFLKSGSQFDLQHTGSLGRHKMQEQAAATQQPAQPSRVTLICGGIGIIALSVAISIMMVIFRLFSIAPVFLLGGGFVMLVAGLVMPKKPYAAAGAEPDAALAAHPHNFAIPMIEIHRAALFMPKSKDKAARLIITVISGKEIKLTINSPPDLETVRGSLLPMLGHKASVS